jgi:hypothetical protein
MVQKEERYEARRKILVGEVEPEKLPLEEGEEDDEAGATPPKGIPQFWMRALANHDAIAGNNHHHYHHYHHYHHHHHHYYY